MATLKDSTKTAGDQWRCPHCQKLNNTNVHYDGDGAGEFTRCSRCHLFAHVSCSVTTIIQAEPVRKESMETVQRCLQLESDEDRGSLIRSVDGYTNPEADVYLDPDQQTIPFAG